MSSKEDTKMSQMVNEINIESVKPYVKKLINNYDISDIKTDCVVFYGVELNSLTDCSIKFRYCDRVEIWKTETGFKIDIYHQKESEAITIFIDE